MTNHYALITGASFGIGRELAKVMAAKHHNLIITARNESELQGLANELKAQYSIEIHVIPCDLSTSEGPIALFNAVKQLSCSVEFLVNNAGFGVYGPFIHTDLTREQALLQLNCISLMSLCKLFADDLIANKGKILNIASVAAFYSGPLMSVYYASKAFVLSFSEALSFELQPFGVSVTAHCPGPTISNFQDAAGMNNSRLFNLMPVPDSATVALHAYNAMMKGQVIAIHGLSNRIMIFLSTLIPRSLRLKAVHAFQNSKS